MFDIHSVLNQTGINNPLVTADYSVKLAGLNLASGESMTITWTDANDGGTDACFGLSNVSVQGVPEPGVVALLARGGGLLLLRRRQTKQIANFLESKSRRTIPGWQGACFVSDVS